eukprot:Amastigsp_a175102_367.p4 type:complete len:136 gc:universal Amastigsp_a175102_367:1630-1223(-)
MEPERLLLRVRRRERPSPHLGHGQRRAYSLCRVPCAQREDLRHLLVVGLGAPCHCRRWPRALRCRHPRQDRIVGRQHLGPLEGDPELLDEAHAPVQMRHWFRGLYDRVLRGPSVQVPARGARDAFCELRCVRARR